MAFPQLTESFGTDQPLDDYADWVALTSNPPGSSVSPFVSGGVCLAEGDASSERFKTHTGTHQTAISTITQCAKLKVESVSGDTGSIGVILRQANANGTGACYHFMIQQSATDNQWIKKIERLTGLTFGEGIVNDVSLQAISDGDWIGFAVSGTGNDTVFKFWDFGSSDPGDFDSWGAATETYTDDPGTAVDTGSYVGLRMYVPNETVEPHNGMSEWAGGDTAAVAGGNPWYQYAQEQ